MGSLYARSPLRSAHLLLFLNKLISLTALMFLLAVGWMAVSYIRAELAGREHDRPAANELSSSPRPASLEKSEGSGGELKPPLRLVYWWEAKPRPIMPRRTCRPTATARGSAKKLLLDAV